MPIHPGARSPSPLERFVKERGLRRFAFFFVTGEGEYLPNGDEEKSGHVIDAHGRIFSFWTGWDVEHETPTFGEWDAVDASPEWLESAEYRRARAAVGLDTPAPATS